MPGSRVRVPPLLLSEPPLQPAAFVFRLRRLFAVFTICAGCQAAQARAPEPRNPQSPADSLVVAAAGDLVCGAATAPEVPCLAAMTASLIRELKPNALLMLGDLQYETGSIQDFGAYFEPLFGEFKEIMYPVPGNHEYFTRGASGYFDYFNGPRADSGKAGHRRRGYYSFELGAWHVVALNTNCPEIGGCNQRSAQAKWLREDLAAHPARCTLAFMHGARFTSGEHGNDELLRELWSILHSSGVDIALSGHDHHYERFAPQDAAGKADSVRGIRAFVVGTGGKGLGRLYRPRPNSEITANNSIGALVLTLRAEDYSWRFMSAKGFSLADSGQAKCTE